MRQQKLEEIERGIKMVDSKIEKKPWNDMIRELTGILENYTPDKIEMTKSDARYYEEMIQDIIDGLYDYDDMMEERFLDEYIEEGDE